MAQEFWVKMQADGEEYGPYTAQQLKEYAAAGQVTPQSLVSLDHATWHAAGRIKNLFSAAAPAVLPPASPAQRTPGVVAPAANRGPRAVKLPAAHVAAVSQPASVVPIAYRSTATTPHGLTPDEQFRGVFLLLYITALVFGLVFLLAGIAVGLAALQLAGGRSGAISYSGLILPTVILLSGVFLAAAGLLGLLRGRSESLLFIGALIFACIRVASAIMELFQRSNVVFNTVSDPWRYVIEAQRTILALAFPVLCFVGIAAVRRARRSGGASGPASPWAPLAQVLGIIAMAAGVFMLIRYGRAVVNLSGSLANISQQGATLRKEALVRSVFAVALSAGMLVGGMMTLLGSLIGRIILLASSAGMLLYVIYLASRYILQVRASTVSGQLLDVTPLSIFVLFAAIVLLRGGLSKAQSA